MKKYIVLLLILAAVVSLLPVAPAVAAEDTAPALVITEVCFNPTFKENDLDMSTSEDVLEFVEVYNPTDTDVSVADCVMRYAKGYAAESSSQNAILTVSDNPRAVKAGKTAIFVCYQGSSATLGYGYANDEEIKAYYDFFCEFFDCADSVALHDFYIFPRAKSGTTDKISGGFNLANTHEEALLRLCRGDEILAECSYNANLWNKNNRSVNMMWYAGMDTEHPLASMPVTTAGSTPGRVYASQVPGESLTAPADTVPVRMMEYNLRADAQTQTAADGSTVTDAMRTARIIEAIREHDPDVLALMETNTRWVKLLDGELIGEGGAYSAYGRAGSGKHHDSRSEIGDWDLMSLILWKTEKYDLIDEGTFWCSKTPNTPNSAGWGNGLTGDMARAINWVILEEKETGAQFLFVAAHLDADSAEIRTLSAALVKEKVTELAQGLPVIITGDFNCSDNSAAYAAIHGDTLYDARYLIPTYGDMTVLGTYNKFGANTDMQVRLPIDLCFVTPETVWVESAESDYAFADAGNSVYASDHNAIIFELKLQKLHTVEPETEEPTAAPTEPVTDPVSDETEAPTEEVPDTSADSDGETPSEPVETATDPDASVPETDASQGCGSALAALTLLVVLPASLCLLHKKREE